MRRRRDWQQRDCPAPGCAPWDGWTVAFDAPFVGHLRYVMVEVFDAEGRSLHRCLLEPGVDLHLGGRILRVCDVVEDGVRFETTHLDAVPARRTHRSPVRLISATRR